MCEECTQYFRKEQLLLYSSIKINPTGDKLDENTDDILSDGENKENSKQIESSSPKRSPLREILKNDKENCQTPSSSLNSMTPLKSISKGLMSQVKSTFKMTTALKPIEEIKEEEKLDIQSWTHSYTPPVNSPYALSPNFTPNGILTSEQSTLSEMKVNRIATPESMISSPVVLSPEVANIYTEPLTFSPAIHIDTFRIMLASIIVVILATAGMIVPQQSVQLRSNDSKILTVPVHFQEFNYIEEIKYEIPEYTGDFSLSDPVHNRNQVGLFLSNISKMFKSIVDRIFGIKNDIMKSFDNLKQELTSKLVHEMRSFGKVF